MAVPYRTAKFKSTSIVAMAIWGPTAKFNSRQYFRLYSYIVVTFLSYTFPYTFEYWIIPNCAHIRCLNSILCNSYTMVTGIAVFWGQSNTTHLYYDVNLTLESCLPQYTVKLTKTRAIFILPRMCLGQYKYCLATLVPWALPYKLRCSMLPRR